MDGRRSHRWSRRKFLGGLALAGSAALVGLKPEPAAAEPPPETRTIRLIYDPEKSPLCFAPMFVASQLFRGEGFTDVRYVTMPKGTAATLATGRADISAMFPPSLVAAIDAGRPVVALMGIHAGCVEIVGTERVRTIRDLKGKKVVADPYGTVDSLFLISMLAYVGVDPRKDVQWVPHPPGWPDASIGLLTEGKVDAMVAEPPAPQKMQARKIGHVILDTATDPPWSQYTCCMVTARRDFVHKYPVATKRALRAIVKADQLCTSEQERSARFLVDKRFNLGASYQETLQTLKDVRYGPVWHDYDPEAALLFHALRMRENGFIKSTPRKIIAGGTDWGFLNELKRELKA